MPIRLCEPLPLSRKDIAIAHDRAYVNGVLDCRLPNGFRGRQPDVAESPLWTTGSFLSAARAALNNGKVVCSPTSGFHHAGYAPSGKMPIVDVIQIRKSAAVSHLEEL
ncbi:hypothetical protein KI614_08635 [Dechloromonas denitrificans]|uniref:hypothetical protein n=1 Tax=Dechloromonas denitrificans TaxID=281362 RepID=UPI001CF8C133|nr:hypothetical protein [Dechloromonas denitrificans]UCV10283.1 hypothetical protein KI614_08635 [Dechloromonas denitrificans]